MQLLKLIDHLPESDVDEGTLYLERPWRPEAEAVCITPSPDTTEPVVLADRRYEYFLEVAIIREFLEDLDQAAGAATSPTLRCSRLIRYAEDDA